MLSEQISLAWTTLKQAESTNPTTLQKGQIKTLFGVLFKIKNRPLIAVKCFQQALDHYHKCGYTQLESIIENKLNICVCLSILKRHQLAKELLIKTLQAIPAELQFNQLKDRVQYNLGVEYEHLGMYEQAKHAYE